LADCWVSIRSSEADLSPDLSRTLVQIHCNQPHLIGDPKVLSRAGAFCFTHHAQPAILRQMGVDLTDKKMMLRPIGALKAFTVRETLSPKFTVGWSGRDTGAKGLDLFVEAVTEAAKTVDLRVTLLGAQLSHRVAQLRAKGIDTSYFRRDKWPIERYPEIYRLFDVLLITSETEAGPLPLFEALASGVPVVSCYVGWSPRLIIDEINGWVVFQSPNLPRTAQKLAEVLDFMATPGNRKRWFTYRHLIRASLMGWTLESWIAENIALARSLVR
jgi:glycosyltransferase involved in cell wall biosynthesis